MELCYKLWSSWDPDAVIADAESGVFADPAKVHRVDHVGEYFRCRGPLSIPQTPQARPTIIQAGASPDGIAFAARHAEVHFAARNSIEGMVKHRKRMNEALAKVGRTAGSMKVLWGALLFVGEDEASARERERRMMERVTPEAGLALMSGHIGIDLSTLPLDKPLERVEVPGSRGIFDAIIEDFGPELTVAELGRRYGCGLSGLRIYGSPGQIADQLEEAYEAGEGDGFMLLSTDCLPGSVDDVVDLVVPELQRRGRLRRSYGEGLTLREQVFGSNTPQAGISAVGDVRVSR
jgi:FMN-dependent oxidoreductase (nitrilotriacetate monooxygenase family)